MTRPFLLFALAIAVLSGACNATAEALPKLDDPTEILEEALRTTAELEYVHARVDVAADIMGSSQSYAVDADLDMGRREFHAVVELAGNGAIAQRVELLLVGTDMFTRMQGGGFGVENDGRWQRTALGQGGDPRAIVRAHRRDECGLVGAKPSGVGHVVDPSTRCGSAD